MRYCVCCRDWLRRILRHPQFYVAGDRNQRVRFESASGCRRNPYDADWKYVNYQGTVKGFVILVENLSHHIVKRCVRVISHLNSNMPSTRSLVTRWVSVGRWAFLQPPDGVLDFDEEDYIDVYVEKDSVRAFVATSMATALLLWWPSASHP
jgi:hypothetical protein